MKRRKWHNKSKCPTCLEMCEDVRVRNGIRGKRCQDCHVELLAQTTQREGEQLDSLQEMDCEGLTPDDVQTLDTRRLRR